MIAFALFIYVHGQIQWLSRFPTEQACMEALSSMNTTGGCAQGRLTGNSP